MTKEEKDELIELSDLNREDNMKYVSSEAQGIAITLDSDRYAPTFCKLERAYICGRRKSEKKIAELEKRIEELQDAKCISCTDLGGMLLKITDLEKKNAELKENYRKRGDIIISLERQIRLNIHSDKLTKAKEIILKLYNAGRDVLMCRTEEKAYDNLSNAINDRSIEQFLKEIEK